MFRFSPGLLYEDLDCLWLLDCCDAGITTKIPSHWTNQVLAAHAPNEIVQEPPAGVSFTQRICDEIEHAQSRYRFLISVPELFANLQIHKPSSSSNPHLFHASGDNLIVIIQKAAHPTVLSTHYTNFAK